MAEHFLLLLIKNDNMVTSFTTMPLVHYRWKLVIGMKSDVDVFLHIGGQYVIYHQMAVQGIC